MTGYTHSFDPGKFNFDKNDFDPEKDTARPTFYMLEEVNGAGELISKEMIKIQSPSEHLNVYGGPVREIDKQRFAKQYDAFRRGEEIIDGTPLSKWPEVASNVEFVSQLRAYGFQTVEDIAKMNDGAIRLFHGAATWRKKAQNFVEGQKKTIEAEKANTVKAENDELKARLAALEAKLASPPKGKPGRKPRVAPTEQTAAA